jgi:hypothetical protein
MITGHRLQRNSMKLFQNLLLQSAKLVWRNLGEECPGRLD